MSAELITVTMTKEHAMAVIHGLEVYQRVSMGAWQAVADYAGDEHSKWVDGIAETLRAAFTPTMHPNGHKGISNASSRAKLTYEVQGILRQLIAMHEGHERHSVWHNDPLNYSGKPLPTAEIATAARRAGL